MAIQNPIQPTTKVLTYTWHVDNGWYGDNYRVVLLKEDSPMCFESAKEAKQYKSKLVRFIKAKHSSAKNVAGKKLVFGNYAEFATYIYCGMGPSYSCANYHVTVEELEAFITNQESSWEFQQKQRVNSFRKEMKAEQRRRRLEV